MVGALPSSLTLRRHPSCVGPTVDAPRVSVTRTKEGVRLELSIEGGLEHLSLPAGSLPAHRLYEHTCLELFLAREDGAGYVEWNLSPTGQATRYEFSAYRTRRCSAFNVPVEISCERTPGALRLVAQGPLLIDGVSKASITAVIRRPDGTCSYWALAHPREVPDFHHAGGFLLDGASVRASR